jgi:transposase
MILNPFKGVRVNYREAARIIGISESCVKKRMHRFKKSCPEAYWKFRALRKEMTHGQRAIDWPKGDDSWPEGDRLA